MRALQDQANSGDPAPARFTEYYGSRDAFDPRAVQVARASGRLPVFSNTPRIVALVDRVTEAETPLWAESNVVTLSIGKIWLQVGIFDPTDSRTRIDVMQSLAAVRAVAPGGVLPLRSGRGVRLGAPLTEAAERVVREPLFLRGEAEYLGSE